MLLLERNKYTIKAKIMTEGITLTEATKMVTIEK